MGFLDKFKGKSAELKDKAEETISANSEKIDAGLDKAADAARRATKGRYDDKIDKATDKAKEGVDKVGEGKHDGPEGGAGGTAGGGPAGGGPAGGGPAR